MKVNQCCANKDKRFPSQRKSNSMSATVFWGKLSKNLKKITITSLLP